MQSGRSPAWQRAPRQHAGKNPPRLPEDWLPPALTKRARGMVDASSMHLAIAAAEHQCPDLIVADHRILDGTGTAAVQAICSEKAIPVVFVTSSGDEVRELVPDALIVPKPFSLPELQVAINTALERPHRHVPR